MKRDMELVRKILLAIEEAKTEDKPIPIKIDGYSAKAVRVAELVSVANCGRLNQSVCLLTGGNSALLHLVTVRRFQVFLKELVIIYSLCRVY